MLTCVSCQCYKVASLLSVQYRISTQYIDIVGYFSPTGVVTYLLTLSLRHTPVLCLAERKRIVKCTLSDKPMILLSGKV